jgi:hypothetical protein
MPETAALLASVFTVSENFRIFDFLSIGRRNLPAGRRPV